MAPCGLSPLQQEKEWLRAVFPPLPQREGMAPCGLSPLQHEKKWLRAVFSPSPLGRGPG